MKHLFFIVLFLLYLCPPVLAAHSYLEGIIAECGEEPEETASDSVKLDSGYIISVTQYRHCLRGSGGGEVYISVSNNQETIYSFYAVGTPVFLNKPKDRFPEIAVLGHGSACCGPYTEYHWNSDRRIYEIVKKERYVSEWYGTRFKLYLQSEIMEMVDTYLKRITEDETAAYDEKLVSLLDLTIWDLLPPEGEPFKEKRALILSHFWKVESEKADRLHDEGKIQEAHEVYLNAEKYAETGAQKKRIYGSLTVTFYELGTYEKSKGYCEKLLRLSPDDKWAKRWLEKIDRKLK